MKFRGILLWGQRGLLAASTALGSYAAGMTVFDWPKPGWTWLAAILSVPLWIWVSSIAALVVLSLVSQNLQLRRKLESVLDPSLDGPILVGPPMPDMTLAEVVKRIRGYLAARDNGHAPDDISLNQINLELADGLSLHDPSVWGRFEGNGALTSLDRWDFRSASVNVSQNEIVVASDWTTVRYRDLRFNRHEVDGIWPPT